MDATRSASRIIGLLILGQIVSGGLVNFVLLAPLFGAPGFLVTAAPHATQIAVAALLGVAAGALTVAIAIAAFPIFKQYSHAMALWFFGLAVASFSVSAVENINVMSMLSLSEEYAKASVADRDQLFQTLRVVVASPRNWAHFINLILAGSTTFVMYAVLCRFALIPRVLAVFGLAAVALQIAAVAMPLFGHSVVFLMLAPLGVSQLILALWLIGKGLRSQATSRNEPSDA
jgi:hypothetical protein